MRGIAILMVLLVHSTMWFKSFDINYIPLEISKSLSFGKYGVALFFIVSAYTLVRSLDIRKEKGYGKYFLRRFLRIAPAYYFVLSLLFIFSSGQVRYLGEEDMISYYNLFLHLTFINGFFSNYFNSIIGTEWTIFVEFFFYITLPLVIIFRKFLFVLLIVFIFISHYNYLFVKLLFEEPTNLNSIQLFFSPITWYFAFLLGMIIYYYSNIIKSILIKYKYFLLLLVFVSLISIIINEFKKPFLEHIFVTLILGMFFTINIYNNIKPFNNNYLKFIGKISFSLYLIHFPIFQISTKYIDYFVLFNNNLLNYIIFSLFIWSICIAISFMMYKFIEKPFIVLGKRGEKLNDN
jgi:peptidoglycan/LPS O-acetylase OafA/YrhL